MPTLPDLGFGESREARVVDNDAWGSDDLEPFSAGGFGLTPVTSEEIYLHTTASQADRCGDMERIGSRQRLCLNDAQRIRFQGTDIKSDGGNRA